MFIAVVANRENARDLRLDIVHRTSTREEHGMAAFRRRVRLQHKMMTTLAGGRSREGKTGDGNPRRWRSGSSLSKRISDAHAT